MPILPNDAKLKDFQSYVIELEKERGFDQQTTVQKCLLLGEEVGELFKAVRKHETGLRMDDSSRVSSVEDELTDVYIYVLAIANRYGIDLQKAFLQKEEVNKKRTWK